MTASPVGRETARVDGPLKVTGGARYAADHDEPDKAHAYAVTSTIGLGTVRALDVDHARSSPGVLDVYSHLHPFRDRMYVEPGLGENYVPFQDNRVRFHGQVIALVVAESFEQARDAAMSVRATYDASPPRASLSGGIPTAVIPPQIPGFPLAPSRSRLAPGVGSIDEALEASEVVVEPSYSQPVHHHVPMEPHSTLAVWRGNQVTVYIGVQGPARAAGFIANRLGIEPQAVHVVSEYVGGGFGGRVMVWNDGYLAAAAARELGRPVKLVLTREQDFTLGPHRAEVVQTVKLGAGRDGVLNALSHLTWTETPAVGGFPMMPASETSAMMYRTRNLHYAQHVVPMDMPPVAAMRGPHEAPGSFALETAMDELAVALDMDPVELRRRNHAEVHPETDRPFSSKHLDECLQVGAARFGWSELRARDQARGEWLHGVGMASAAYPAHRDPAQVRVVLKDDDTSVVSTATSDLGTGAWTVLAITGADALGIPTRRVIPRLGDSLLPVGAPAARSAATASTVPALQAAARGAIAALLELATTNPSSPWYGQETRALRYENGRVVGPTNESLTFGQLLRRIGAPSAGSTASAPRGPEAQQYAFYSFGAHFCEVRVNRFTKEPRIVRFTSVMDIGRAVNPRTLRSQITGGIIFGIGQALLEHNPLEAATGRLAASNLADYMVPVNADIPHLDVHWLDVPDTVLSSFGARGAGEIGTVGAAAAVGNAIFNATGIRVRDLPITLDKLLTEPTDG